MIHRENIDKIVDLGWQLFSLNPNIVWRIEDYYAMGIRADLRSRFEIEDYEFEQVRNRINQTFGHLFKHISFSKRQDRVQAPDFFITPSADLVTSSDNRVSEPKGNILEGQLPSEFRMRRPWSDYRKVCRDWGWGDLD